MNDFLKFLDKKLRDFPMHVEIGYNKTCDWSIYIYKKGRASDYLNSERNGQDAVIVDVQERDMEPCFAKAHVALKDGFRRMRAVINEIFVHGFCKHEYETEYLHKIDGGMDKLYKLTCKKCGKEIYARGGRIYKYLRSAK